jgi:hypothetical protein
MEKILLEKYIKELTDKNFDQFSKYLDNNFQVFIELNHSVEEVAKCLILHYHKAAITLTNNILGRLLKLSLFYNEVGVKPVPIERWNSVFAEPNRKYGSLPLDKSIELCKNHDLIDQSEKDYLIDSVKKLIINGYFNADPIRILEIPTSETIEEDAIDDTRDDLNQKIIPPLQSMQIENFTRSNAVIYFEFVFELIENIERRLIEKSK